MFSSTVSRKSMDILIFFRLIWKDLKEESDLAKINKPKAVLSKLSTKNSLMKRYSTTFSQERK